MAEAKIDYKSVFRHLPVPVLLLTPDLVIVAANSAYERISGRTSDELAGRPVLDAFPDNPDDPAATGAANASRRTPSPRPPTAAPPISTA